MMTYELLSMYKICFFFYSVNIRSVNGQKLGTTCLLGHLLILSVVNMNSHLMLSFIRISPMMAHIIMGFICLMVHGCLPVLFITLSLSFMILYPTRFAVTLLHNTLQLHVRVVLDGPFSIALVYYYLWICTSFIMWIGSLGIIKIVSNRFRTQQTDLESLALIYFPWAYDLGLLHIKFIFFGNNPNAGISILQTFHLHSCLHLHFVFVFQVSSFTLMKINWNSLSYYLYVIYHLLGSFLGNLKIVLFISYNKNEDF